MPPAGVVPSLSLHGSAAVNPTLNDEKKRLRSDARGRRAAAAKAAPLAKQHIVTHFLHAIRLRGGECVAGYWPMRDEIDPLPLLEHLGAQGHPLALPVVVARDKPLSFRAWQHGDTLEQGDFNTQHPVASRPVVTPDVVLVPLLAFDDAGHRLGYGGGHYDRTLQQLRKGSVLAVGLAYEGQRVSTLPLHENDQRLDWIVTEQGARHFA